MKWTDNKIEEASELINAGKSYKEISVILDCSIKSLGNILSYNKIKKPIHKKQIQCLLCGNITEESINSKRKFCNTSCAAKYNNPGRIQNDITRDKISKSLCINGIYIHKEPKVDCCLYCKKQLNKQKKYCSTSCQMSHKENIKLNEWLTGKIKGYVNGGSFNLLTVVRKWLFDRAQHKCEECGCNKINPYTNKSILQVDHIDGDVSNDKPENLKVLCPTCHSMTPTYGFNNARQSKRYTYRKNQRS